jgi:hypothetical protein
MGLIPGKPFLFNKIEMEHILLPVLHFPPVSVIPPMLEGHFSLA